MKCSRTANATGDGVNETKYRRSALSFARDLAALKEPTNPIFTAEGTPAQFQNTKEQILKRKKYWLAQRIAAKLHEHA